MALAIDTNHMLQHCIPRQERNLKYGRSFRNPERVQLHRAYAYATVVHDASTIRTSPAMQAALDWQADQEDDLDDVEVFHRLKQMAATIKCPQTSQISGATTLLASVQCPTFTAHAKGRPPSSFHRISLRMSLLCNYVNNDRTGFNFGETDNHKVISKFRSSCSLPYWLLFAPKIVWATTADKSAVLWHMQLDFVDLFTPSTHPTSNLGKRRRTLNPFLRVSPAGVEDTLRGNHLPEAKRFKGVRYRPDRRTWVAEMKPSKSKNKLSFGDFKSQTQAARAVDAAFHHYGKTDHVNFADTPQILSSTPTPAGLNEKDKLRFVKQQAKWLASMASTLPSTPSSATRATTDLCSATLEFRSFPKTTSLSFDDNKEEQNTLQWSILENAIVNPCDIAITQRSELPVMPPNSCAWADLSPARNSSSSSVHITEQWNCDLDYSSGSALTSFVSLIPEVESPCEIQRSMCMDFLSMSPPAPSVFQDRSPSDFQGDVADGLLEQQSFECE